uniref:Venom pacifastin Pr22a n=1 Tax=Platymeris rhadamanthus TaxID=1134088 RepID=A0A6B9L1G0_PLARH|nr:venom pacifastin Pr22a [Platymeris rhadamanthus]
MTTFFVLFYGFFFLAVTTANKCDLVGKEYLTNDGCTKCRCSEDKVRVCTNVCFPPRGPECVPGTKVPVGDGCNTCSCTATGEFGPCTSNVCPRSNTECTPGAVVLSSDGCNRCRCSIYGTILGCTRMACFPGMKINADLN